jgi:hypothetical protein
MTMKAMKRSMIAVGFLAGLLAVGSAINRAGEGGGEGLIAVAQAQPAKLCSESTIKGTYAFGLNGAVKGVGPVALAGTATYDGVGQARLEGFVNSTVGAPAVNTRLIGPYTVNPATCTATATFNAPPPGIFGVSQVRFFAVIVDGGAEIRYVVTTPGIAVAGSTVRQASTAVQ